MASVFRKLQVFISLVVLYSACASIELSPNESLTENTIQENNFKKLSDVEVKGNGSFSLEAKERNLNIVISPNEEGKITNGLSTQKELPTSIEVNPESVLYIESGLTATINLQVTNNRYSYIYYTFDAFSDDLLIRQIIPRRSYISPTSSLQVRVLVSPSGQSTSQTLNKLVTFSAKWSTLFPYNEERVIKRVYVHIGKQPTDSYKPDISYTYDGDCSGSNDPKNCNIKNWRADFKIQDEESGLLMIKSIPVGLVLDHEFIVGTKDLVTGSYRGSCCQTKVDITARDLNGNERTIAIDIEKIWLTTGEIIAIVLGSILLLLLITGIIFCIFYCIRRKRSRTLNIYPEPSR